MYDVKPRPVKTGSDPRTLADFIALREEMAKLTHPARPDVNWPQVEMLSLSLFELNGVELQTGAWYTLARSHLARINGLNEGLIILTALLSHRWAQLWPQPGHARVEILNGLFQRLQKLFRTFSLGHGDVPALMQAEGLLQSMSDILARQELKHACQTTPLMQQINNALTRLENSSSHESSQPAVTLPPQALAAVPAEGEASPVSRLMYVIRPESEVEVQVVHQTLLPPKRWPVFMAGACSALVVGALALWGGQVAHRVDDVSQALTASVAPLPQTLTGEQLRTLRTQDKNMPDAATWLKQASAQLEMLAALPPDWALRQGNALIGQALALWPDDPAVTAMQKQWLAQRADNALAPQALTGWHDGMMQLQALSEQLEQLDRQRGKYLTGSELKSMVFRMMNSFRQTVPLEEQLRVLRSQKAGQESVSQQQVQRHLSALLNLYGEEPAASQNLP